MSILQDFLKGKTFEEARVILSEKPYCCEVKTDEDYPEYFLIKYNQINSDFNNPIVRECRGVILDRNYNIVCRPFDKFGNYGEGYVPDIDWPSARVQEKIDGSLVKGWWSEIYQRWMISTNGMIDAYKAEIQNDLSPFATYGEMFRDHFRFVDISAGYTYLFEMASPYTRIVVQYPEVTIYHIGTRCNITGEYMEVRVDDFPHPKEFHMNNLEDVVKMAQELPFNEEGYVVVDKDYNRIKIKSPAYVSVHHLKNNGVINRRRLLDLILIGEDAEFINYFPEYAKDMGEVQDKYGEFMGRVAQDIKRAGEFDFDIQDIVPDREQRKVFASWATKTTYSPLMFSLWDGKVVIGGWRDSILSIPSEKLLAIIDKAIK